MAYLRAAVPARPRPPETLPSKEYEVVSDRCVWGKPGEVVQLALTEGQELSLLQAGTVKLADRPSSAETEG